MTEVAFIVPGKPLTWQRARHGRHGPHFTPADRENKMSEVRDAWHALGAQPFERGAYLALGVAVYCDRPAGHFSARGGIKPRYEDARPLGGTNGGDLDNFIKLVKDALNKVAYHDDAQIVEYLPGTGKFYAGVSDMPRTEVRIAPLGEPGEPLF